MIEKKLAKTVRVLCASGLLVTGMTSAVAYAEEVQKVEILGSSIKRIAKEGALPVQTLSNAEIQKSGAKTVEDLIQNLPAMQGFTASSSSVNGSGGGVQTASVHGIGESYTLVLLNGRRMAPYGSGSAVNLASIPMSAVERVEVLTDGASALYGSDAIAGVVNFVLKKNQTDAVIDATYNGTTQSGGQSYNASISKGFGNLEENGYNVLVSYSHDEVKELNASQREFGKTGLAKFMHNGKLHSMYQGAINTSPASVGLDLKNGGYFEFSPNYARDKKCGPNTFLVKDASTESCWFDYAGTVMLQPSSKRDSFFGSLNYKINEDTTLFAEAVASRYNMKARYAPAAQFIGMDINGDLYKNNVLPYLGQYNLKPEDIADAGMNMRFVDAGGRTRNYIADSRHFAIGINGSFRNIDYTVSYVHSENKNTSEYAGGFMSKVRYNALLAAKAFDPFAAAGSSAAILAPAVLHETEDVTKVKLDTISVRGSGELFKVNAGAVQFGAGADFSRQTYVYAPSAIHQGKNPQQPNFADSPLGDSAGALPADASRKNWGTFGELFIPVLKNLDITTSARYDSYSAVTNNSVFDTTKKLIGTAEQGEAQSKATYKIGASYRPVDALMLRGSYATGFKVAPMTSIANPVSYAGVTSGAYPCPVQAPDPRAQYCKGKTQYDLLSGGNALTGANALKPEKSTQYTLGFRVEPTSSLSLGMDLWMVKIKDQLADLPETMVFGDPGRYSSLIQVIDDQNSGRKKIAVLLPTQNLAESYNKGLDWDHSYKAKTGIGEVSVNWTGTYMLNSDYALPGKGIESSVGRFDSYNNVVFRIISRLATTWKQNAQFSHTLAMNYKSGYHDMKNWVKEMNPDGTYGNDVEVERDVSPFITFDWQTRYQLNKALTLTAGVKNMFNVDPPFSIRTQGGGNQIGFDARYASALGRQIYVTGNYRF
ncbi:TonB-dependent receptor domain-containing protein [Undibacterium squillarum]|uniref:TonB-dependent receptor domain-containing protein n=1 Tax=Undibacterium squillarum TaxID=1131567 RepID=UPI0035B3D5E7